MNKPVHSIVLALIVAGVAATGGWWSGSRHASHRHPVVDGGSPRAAKPAAEPPRDVLYWYDPMRPDQHFDRPGKSPFMDMDLVPKYAADTAGSADEGTRIRIDPRMVQNLGMRTARVSRRNLGRTIEAAGSVEVDERRIAVVESRAAGWVERLDVRAVGDPVRQGQVLARVYAPELSLAKEELELAQRLQNQVLIDAAKTRLQKLGSSSAPAATARPDLILAPQSGFVTELMVRQGGQLVPGMPLMRIADLSRVWISIELPESLAAVLREGLAVTAQLQGLPGRSVAGTVEHVYPTVDRQTRTLRARIALDNPDGTLKPGMYARVSIAVPSAAGPVLAVPSEAVIRTGTRTVVILAEAAGRYRPVFIVAGTESGEYTTVLQGLEAGQEVVVSGQFLIDSEASLLGAYQRMETSP